MSARLHRRPRRHTCAPLSQAAGGALVVENFGATRIEWRNLEMKNKKLKYVIARTYSAGVFAGELERRKGQEVVLRRARRLWYWAGAASLSQLAVSGTSNPSACKFPVPVDRVELLQVIEILDVTPEARRNIEGVPIWRS